MTLVSRDGTALVFALHDWERAALAAVLGHYPQIPPGSFEMSKEGLRDGQPHDSALHEELFIEHQHSNRVRVRKFIAEKLAGPDATDEARHMSLHLDLAEANWLLQVLNDIRVGGWIKLGRPDEATLRKLARSRKMAPALGVMEFCAYAQTEFLDALMG